MFYGIHHKRSRIKDKRHLPFQFLWYTVYIYTIVCLANKCISLNICVYNKIEVCIVFILLIPNKFVGYGSFFTKPFVRFAKELFKQLTQLNLRIEFNFCPLFAYLIGPYYAGPYWRNFRVIGEIKVSGKEAGGKGVKKIRQKFNFGRILFFAKFQ